MTFENGDENVTQVDANLEASSTSPESSDSQNLGSSAPETEAPREQSQSVPFHEDPRIAEFVERQVRKQTEAYEQMLEDIRREYDERFQRIGQPQKEANPFVARLREIDPRYAEYIEGLEAKASETTTLAQDLAELKRERLLNQYESTVDRLHNESKLSPELRSFVKNQLDAMARSGQIKKLDDVPAAYKSVADQVNKLIEDTKRAERAQYVQQKSKDAQAPTAQPKGKAPVRNEKGQFTSKDPEEIRAQMVRAALKISRAEGDI